MFCCVSGSGGPLLFDDLPPASSGDSGKWKGKKSTVLMEILCILLLRGIDLKFVTGFRVTLDHSTEEVY